MRRDLANILSGDGVLQVGGRRRGGLAQIIQPRGHFPIYDLPLTHSLLPVRGSEVPLFSRATTGTVIDFEGVVHTALIDEARFAGTLRVRNLSDDTEVYATETITVLSGIDYIFAFSGTGSVTFSGAATGTLAGTGSERVEVTKTTASTSLTITVTGSVLQAQLEKVSGTQTSASEYVSTGVLSYPYHGSGVDGVKCFTTDRSGVAIPAATLGLLMNEPDGTNLALWSQDFSNVVWAKQSSVTIASNSTTAPDGTFTANKYSISAPNNRAVAQTVSHTDAILSTWIKAITDTSVSLGNKTISILASDGWQRISTDMVVSGTSIQFFDDSGSTGDRFYIWGTQLEESPFPTSYIKTEATTVTRTADSCTVDNSARDILPNSFCLAGTWIPLGDGADYASPNIRLFGSQDSRGQTYEEICQLSTIDDYTIQIGGGIIECDNVDINQATPNKYAFQLHQDGANVNAKIYKDGVQKLSEVETQTLDHSNPTLELGSWAGTVFACNMGNIKIYDTTRREVSEPKLARLTT